VCYQWDIFPNERFKLDVKSHSALSERQEHPRQTAYSVHGKVVNDCGRNTMVTITGTVVTAAGEGAHMGLTSHASRPDGSKEGDSCRSIVVDCTTEETDQAPDTWTCFSRNEFDIFHGLSHLNEVEDEARDPLCSFFDGPVEDAASVEAGASAGGLRQ
jgi:hypothetical protein